MTPLIELREVTKVYGGGLLSKGANVALHELSLTIQGEQPQIIAVVGESGSGKTTLASLIMGFIQPNEGEVLYKGKDLRKLSGKDYFQFRREVQAVFQDPFAAYNPFYKVDHVLSVPIKKFGLTASKTEAREMMERALSTSRFQWSTLRCGRRSWKACARSIRRSDCRSCISRMTSRRPIMSATISS